MSTSTPAFTPPTSAEARAVVDRAIDRYITARHDKVTGFVDANYSLIGSLRLHRKALGLDLLRAPANVALALPYLGSRRRASKPPAPIGWPSGSGAGRSFSTPTLRAS
jgi:hypothetical protein